VTDANQEPPVARCTIGAAAAILLVVTVAASASAKGISRAHFSGPGLPPEGVTLIRATGIQATGLVAPKERSLAALGIEREDLGTPYQARYRMDYAPRHVLRQVVYPYAPGGAVTFTPGAQHVGPDYETFPGGWHAAGPRLLRMLIAHGFPGNDPAHPEKAASGANGDHDGLSATNINRSDPSLGRSLVAVAVLLIPLVLFAAGRAARTWSRWPSS
jgi:hypothetical protein